MKMKCWKSCDIKLVSAVYSSLTHLPRKEILMTGGVTCSKQDVKF